MPRPDVDIAILGGGCAGLSAAVRLAAAGRSLQVIEPREAYVEDRAWSFWRTARDPFEDCVRRSWSAWDVIGPGGPVHRGSSRLRYQTIGAGAVYDRAQALIGDHPQAELTLGTAAHAMTRMPDGWRIDTDAGQLTARHVIDSRPPRRRPGYGQFFLGREIRTERPVFDPDTVQLMQFRAPRSAGVDFVYILPFAPDLALVEVTSFAPQAPDRHVFEGWLREEIDALDCGAHEVVREERGALPMEVGFHDPSPEGCIRMGLGGGAARPSTGYAFARIQRQADLVTRAIVDGRPLPASLDGPAARFMDRVFLQVIQAMPERGPALFESLFRNAGRDRLELFLSGSVSPADRLSVMTSLPTLPFLRAALFPGMIRAHWQTALFGAAGLGAVALQALVEPGITVQVLALAPLVALLGLPHGALDLPIAEALWPLTGWRRKALFAAAYLGLAGAVIAVWLVAPGASLAMFLGYSALHFSGDWAGEWPPLRWSGGIATIGAPALLHHGEVSALFAILAPDALASIVADAAAVAGALALAGLVACVVARRARGAAALEQGMLWITAALLPPLMYFAVYFCALHSIRHFTGTMRQVPDGTRAVAWAAALSVGVTLAAGAVLQFAAPLQGIDTTGQIIRILFIGLAALTVPHMILVERFARAGQNT